MRAGALLAGVLAAAALVWLQSPELHWAARIWTAVLMAPFPALMILQARQLAVMPALPRRAAYLSSIVSLWLLALITLAIAVASGYGMRELGFDGAGAARIIGAALLVATAAVAVQFAFRFAGVREAPVLRQLLPISTSDRWLFVAVAITAGICEELVFRGFLLHSLTLATGITWFAVLLSAGAFGVVHAYQHTAGALRAALLGVLLTLPILHDASIISSMLAHAIINVVSGIWLARFLITD